MDEIREGNEMNRIADNQTNVLENIDKYIQDQCFYLNQVLSESGLTRPLEKEIASFSIRYNGKLISNQMQPCVIQ